MKKVEGVGAQLHDMAFFKVGFSLPDICCNKVYVRSVLC